MARSIMQDKKDRQCYICKHLRGDDACKPILEEHHVFYGTGLRRLSERHGLKVMLCPRHHRGNINGYSEAVHGLGREEDAWLKRRAQRAWMHRNAPYNDEERAIEEFIRVFGRNYI